MKMLKVMMGINMLLVGCGKKLEISTTEKVKDVVCNMWIDKAPNMIKGEFDNTDYYFCAQECKEEFLKNPLKYTKKCRCDTYKKCNCDHCSGKRVPCDCE